jgi:hypothetical protein
MRFRVGLGGFPDNPRPRRYFSGRAVVGYSCLGCSLAVEAGRMGERTEEFRAVHLDVCARLAVATFNAEP